MIQPIDEKSARYRIIKLMFNDKFQEAEVILSEYTVSGATGISSSRGGYQNHPALSDFIGRYRYLGEQGQDLKIASCVSDKISRALPISCKRVIRRHFLL